MAAQVSYCAANAQNFVTGLGYSAGYEMYACAPGINGAGYIRGSSNYHGEQADVENQCIIDCRSTTGCKSLIVTDLDDTDQGQWRCDFYSIDLPSQGLSNQCPGNSNAMYPTIYGMYPETINSCLAASPAAATAFCSSYLDLPDPVTETAYTGASVTKTSLISAPIQTATSYIKALVTRTVFATVPVTTTSYATNLANNGVSTVTATRTVVKTVCAPPAMTTTPAPSPHGGGLKVIRAKAPGQNAVNEQNKNKSKNKKLRIRQDLPAPACLNTASTNTPADLIMSGCSCLSIPDTVTVPYTTATTPVTVLATTTATFFLTLTTTAPVVTASLTSILPVTVGATTSISVPITATTTRTITTTRTTTAVFGTASAIEVFALVAKPAPAASAAPTTTPKSSPAAQSYYRLFPRILGGSGGGSSGGGAGGGGRTPAGVDRVLQYRKPTAAAGSGPQVGINATIIDGRLYVMSPSGNNNNNNNNLVPRLSLCGLGKLTTGPNAGQLVLEAEQHSSSHSSSSSSSSNSNSNLDTALTGCSIDKTHGNVISCNLAGSSSGGGGPVALQLQELSWPTTTTTGGSGQARRRNFMLGLVDSGTGTTPKGGGHSNGASSPVMQLAGMDFATVAVGCGA